MDPIVQLQIAAAFALVLLVLGAIFGACTANSRRDMRTLLGLVVLQGIVVFLICLIGGAIGFGCAWLVCTILFEWGFVVATDVCAR